MTVGLALLLGLVEGVTEFLPISSTGHLILVSHWAGLEGARAEVFDIFIQLGAVLAVVAEYRSRLFGLVLDLPRRPEARRFAFAVGLAFVPMVVAGLLFHDRVTERLFGPGPVAAALIAGALLIFVVEAMPRSPRTLTAESVGVGQAIAVGLTQCLALFPGFSRSAATILGGMVFGMERRAATEFSFFLAIPTLGAATVYSLIKNLAVLQPGDGVYLAIATAVSFGVAWAAIRWLLRFVATHSLRPFAYYRIGLGLLVLYLLRSSSR